MRTIRIAFGIILLILLAFAPIAIAASAMSGTIESWPSYWIGVASGWLTMVIGNVMDRTGLSHAVLGIKRPVAPNPTQRISLVRVEHGTARITPGNIIDKLVVEEGGTVLFERDDQPPVTFTKVVQP